MKVEESHFKLMDITMKYVYREANAVADFFAKDDAGGIS